MFKLEVLNTAFKGKQFKFKEGLAVGSSESCQIRAQHQDMQALHARFYEENHIPMVEIGCKEARLYVNGKDVVRSAIKHGDELVVGPLRFKIIDSSQDTAASRRLEQLMEDLEKHSDEEVIDFAREDLFYRITKEPSLRKAVAFVIPSKDKFIDQAQVFLARLVRQADVTEEKIDSFMTCAKELILNAHRHGHQYDESKRIIIRFRDLGDNVRLIIADEGKGFDHQTVIDNIKNKDAAQAARERYQAGGFGGLGFKLVVKLADELIYNQPGNQVTITIKKKSE